MTPIALLPLGEFMRRIELKRYVHIGSLLTFLIQYGSGSHADDEVIPLNRDIFTKYLSDIEEDANALDMTHLVALVKDARNQIHSGTMRGKETSRMFHLLDTALKSQLSGIFVCYVPADHAQYWQQEKPFGDAVHKNFPSARADFVDAGNCFAIEQYTACVFHCIRAAEKGMRAIARERKIKIIKGKPLEWNDWGQIIKAIEDAANQLATKLKFGPQRDRALEFYRGVAGELYGFKDAYRNYVTHDRATYDLHQAASVYHRVGEFMQRVSVYISEEKRGAISWPKK
jgi:hypothetical protein